MDNHRIIKKDEIPRLAYELYKNRQHYKGYDQFHSAEDILINVCHFLHSELQWHTLNRTRHDGLLGSIQVTKLGGWMTVLHPDFGDVLLSYLEGKTNIKSDVANGFLLLSSMYDGELREFRFKSIDFRGVYIGNILFSNLDSHCIFESCHFDYDSFIIDRDVEFDEDLYTFLQVEEGLAIRNEANDKCYLIDEVNGRMVEYDDQYGIHFGYDTTKEMSLLKVPSSEGVWQEFFFDPDDGNYYSESVEGEGVIIDQGDLIRVISADEKMKTLYINKHIQRDTRFHIQENEGFYIVCIKQKVAIVQSFDGAKEIILDNPFDNMLEQDCAYSIFYTTEHRYVTWETGYYSSDEVQIMVFDILEGGEPVVVRLDMPKDGYYFLFKGKFYVLWKNRLFRVEGGSQVLLIDFKKELGISSLCRQIVYGEKLYVHNTEWIIVFNLVSLVVEKVINFDGSPKGTFIGEGMICHNGTVYKEQDDEYVHVASYRNNKEVFETYDLDDIEDYKALLTINEVDVIFGIEYVCKNILPDVVWEKMISPLTDKYRGSWQGDITLFEIDNYYVVLHPNQQDTSDEPLNESYYDPRIEMYTNEFYWAQWYSKEGYPVKREKVHPVYGKAYYNCNLQQLYTLNSLGSCNVNQLGKGKANKDFYIPGMDGRYGGCEFRNCFNENWSDVD